MDKIASIDRNFLTAEIGNDDIDFLNALEAPFVLEGFPWRKPGMPLFRLPSGFTDKEINQGALSLAHCSAGGAIRFCSNSKWIIVRAVLAHSIDSGRMPRSGSGGFDLYGADDRIGNFMYAESDGLIWIPGSSPALKKLRFMGMVEPTTGFSPVEQKLSGSHNGTVIDFQLNLPLYGGIEKLEIGVVRTSILEPPVPHKITKPILFHGSSITQGGCASRPGNAYTSMLCRKLDAEQINLGFSGSGMAEPALAEAVAKLDLALLVLDAGHTKHNLDFYKTVRTAHPELPIVIISKSYDAKEKVSRATYDYAIGRRDKKIIFFDGMKFFDESECPYADACTVDGIHPNDLGFYRMYQALLPVLENALRL